MAKSAFVTLVEASSQQEITLDNVLELLHDYKEQLAKTGAQLAWDYAGAAFPYEIRAKAGQEDRWFYLKGTSELYRHILFAVDQQRKAIQITLTDESTHGDNGKAVEFVKWLAKRLQAELTLFNGRKMYFYPRK